MNNSTRIIGVTVLAAIYCFAVGIATISSVDSVYKSHPTPQQKQSFATISSSLFCHTSQSEDPVSSFNNLPAPDLKNLFDKLWATAKSIEQIFKTEFNQYCSFSTNFLIQYRKSDIIFPFQYFW